MSKVNYTSHVMNNTCVCNYLPGIGLSVLRVLTTGNCWNVVGSKDGEKLGSTEGSILGSTEGSIVGTKVGKYDDGVYEGKKLGNLVGFLVGAAGFLDGFSEGFLDGNLVGFWVGFLVVVVTIVCKILKYIQISETKYYLAIATNSAFRLT